MSPTENPRIAFDADASTLAFRAGQFVERLLLERGLEVASSSQMSVVTSEAIQSSMDDSLLDDLRKHLNGQVEQQSRKVA